MHTGEELQVTRTGEHSNLQHTRAEPHKQQLLIHSLFVSAVLLIEVVFELSNVCLKPTCTMNSSKEHTYCKYKYTDTVWNTKSHTHTYIQCHVIYTYENVHTYICKGTYNNVLHLSGLVCTCQTLRMKCMSSLSLYCACACYSTTDTEQSGACPCHYVHTPH